MTCTPPWCIGAGPDARKRRNAPPLATRVAAALEPRVAQPHIGSTEGAPRDTGPPRRTARGVVAAIEPALEILELRSTMFHSKLDPAQAWFCLARRRRTPVQPSTLPR